MPMNLHWGDAAQTGAAYLPLPRADYFTVVAPSGGTISEGDLYSYRYRHHTKVAVKDGRVWVAYSASGTNEDASGQRTLVQSAPVADLLIFNAPLTAIGKQSTWSSTGASYASGTFITYPRHFVHYDDKLYLVAALDKISASATLIGEALIGVECKSDGTLGTPFRVSSASYTAYSGFSTISYDAVLGPALYDEAAIFGNWGGSTPDQAASPWVGWASYLGHSFVEPATFAVVGDELLRLWRRTTTPDEYLYAQRSLDGGVSWGAIYRTAIPDSPSSACVLRLVDGRIVLIGNPKDGAIVRNPLYLAVFNSAGVKDCVYALRTQTTDAPVYAGTHKIGGAAYPSVCEDNGLLYVAYSLQKEVIGLSRCRVSQI